MEKGDRNRSGGSNSRDRDRNREYESGSKKRAKKKKTEKMISELPKITSMFTRKPAASQSESDDMQTPSSSSSLAEPTTTLHHDDTCPDSVIPAPYDDSDTPCAPPPAPSPNDISSVRMSVVSPPFYLSRNEQEGED